MRMKILAGNVYQTFYLIRMKPTPEFYIFPSHGKFLKGKK